MKSMLVLLAVLCFVAVPAMLVPSAVASAQTVLNDSLHPGHITLPRVWMDSPAEAFFRITHTDTSATNDTLILRGYKSTDFAFVLRRTKSAAKPLTPPPVYLQHLLMGVDTVIVTHQTADTLTYDLGLKRKAY